MKKFKYSIYILPLVFLLAFSGCEDFDDLNADPTKSTNMDPNLQIPTIQMRQTENHQEWARYFSYPAGFMNQWTGNWATIEYGGHGKKYDNYMEQMWISYYPFMIKNVVDVIQRTKEDPELVNINSIGRILKVQCFHKITDVYGDVPYFDAGMGYYNGVFKVKYDTQEEIYNDLLKELKEASEALDPAKDKLTHDLYYNGDLTKWKKFANSLRLRLAMRLIKVDPARARQEAEAAIAAGVFESNNDACTIKHEDFLNPPEGVGKGNGVAIRLLNPEDPTQSGFRFSTELITVMEDSKDPRILLYGSAYFNDGDKTDITAEVKKQLLTYKAMSLPAQQWPWDEGNWKAAITITLPNGNEVSVEHNLQRLQPSKTITALDAAYVHLSYAEVKFLMAEAAIRGWNTGSGTAKEHYEEALRAAVTQWDQIYKAGNYKAVTSDQIIDDFIKANALKTGTELMQINTQLWILHILDPIETWSNWRRTGMPDLVFHNFLPSANNSGGQFPRRLEYPLEEQMKNRDNYYEALDRMGGEDDWTNRVWWDKK